MPYPTPTRYLRQEEAQRYGGLEEKNLHLQAAFAQQLAQLREHPRFDRTLPTVLAAHVHVQGATLPNLFRMNKGAFCNLAPQAPSASRRATSPARSWRLSS
jgi:exonuclease SbcD